ncbi:MFS transporter [Streptomyces sp. ISL-98]|nr:MFS transporter [Streptomyces sp. ISL-98]
MGIDNVLGVSLRQRLTPDALLGRMNATFRFMLTGAVCVGSAMAGAIGEFAGVHIALWVGGSCLALAFLPVFLSPVADADRAAAAGGGFPWRRRRQCAEG